jgi:hypothetical protein
MRTTLDLPDDVFRQLKAESALRGLKMKELVTELIQSGLARRSDADLPSKRSPLPVIRKSTGKIHPAKSNREIEDLLSEEDSNGQS